MAVSRNNDGNNQLIVKTMEKSMRTISPIDKVPAEILSHIFLQCLPEPRRDIVPDPSGAPLLLCQISGYWRNLALSTPRLWCTILLSRFRTTAWLQTWLARSRACPLSVYVDSNKIPSTSFDTIVERSRQWRHLRIDNLDSTSLPALCNVPSDATPLLESFTHTCWRDDAEPRPHQFTFLHSAPRLRAIELLGNFSLPLCILPWAQITSLCLHLPRCDNICLNDCMRLLSQCLSITQLNVSLHSREPENHASYIGPPIFLPSLTSLRIHTHWHTTVLLSHVVAPSLLSLRITGSEIWPHTAFLSFIQQSALITDLSFVRGLSEDQFIDYLKNLPFLARLSVEDTVITDQVLELLSLSNSGSCLLPNLEHLLIYVLEMQKFSSKALVDMILSRWNSYHDTLDGGRITQSTDQPRVARLKSVDILGCWWQWPRSDAEIKLVFRRLAREGLKITLGEWKA